MDLIPDPAPSEIQIIPVFRIVENPTEPDVAGPDSERSGGTRFRHTPIAMQSNLIPLSDSNQRYDRRPGFEQKCEAGFKDKFVRRVVRICFS